MSHLYLVLLASLLLHVASAGLSPSVTIPQGSLVGTTLTTRGGREVSAFLGIPYAAPPTGHLRFKSPQPPLSWEGERDASKEGSECIQQVTFIPKLQDVIVGSEDCLFLNVFTPKAIEKDILPVMIYIHGGAFAGGSGDKVNYGPDLLLDRDVVLVTINYRLGPLGFLSTGDTVLPGNLGMKDQSAALQWVQHNIEHFGGNKNSVTIFGESAGGASVQLHVQSPLSKGLFHAAISQSGSSLGPCGFSNRARHKQLASKLAQLVDCPLQPSEKFRDCLMALPAENIVGVQKHFMIWDMDPVVLFTPAEEPEEVEDAFLTQDPWTLSTRSDIPWMIGLTSEDGAIKTTSLTQGDVEGKFQRLNDDLYSILPMSFMYQYTAQNPDKVTDAIKKFYFDEVDKITPDMTTALTKMFTDGWLSHGILESVRRHSGPVFVYYFAYNRSFSLCSVYYDNPWHPGVCHFDELMYLFPMEGHAPTLGEDGPDYIMSKQMVELWTNFAKNRIPALDDSGQFWQTKKGSTKDYLLISNNGFSLQQNLLAERDQFWQSLPFRDEKSPVKRGSKYEL
uniref:Carboxylic ester hydrolase n=1 Tax=Graphocephala atropunctata TaxID=36148 RepID=A0A1B6L7B7_9HEMI